MCDPLTIGGIALSVGSTVMNNSAQNATRRAREDAMAAERMRQRQFDDESYGLNTQSQDRYGNFGEQQEERRKSLADMFNEQAGDENRLPETGFEGSTAASPTSSNITIREQNRQLDRAGEFSRQQGDALGNLRSFGDLLGGIGRQQGRDAGQIGMVGGFKRASQNILPLELEAANNAGRSRGLFGDILGGLGGLAMQRGLRA